MKVNGKLYRSIWAAEDGWGVDIIDQTRLPHEFVTRRLESLDDATLARQPSDQCNSIAWLLWHMSRVVDTFMTTRFRGKPQLWISEDWHRRFGMAGDPDDRGVGWTAAQVAAWSAPASQALTIGAHPAACTATMRGRSPSQPISLSS